MEKRERIRKIIEILKDRYPDPKCSHEYSAPLQLLVATRLAAQCTDARVNMITPALFERYPAIEDFANAELSELEQLIHSCGLYRTKARDIKAMAKMIIGVYGGVIPDTIEELTKLPGGGRKTANLIVGDVYGKPAVGADTHCIRISNRLGLCSTKNP